MSKYDFKVGEPFIAIVKKGKHSKTLLGEEGAGRELGPFIATKLTMADVSSKCSIFRVRDFDFRRAE